MPFVCLILSFRAACSAARNFYTGSVPNTFMLAGTNSLLGWQVLVPGPISLNAGVSATVVVTISIAATAASKITDTATLTVTAPGMVSAFATLLTGTGCRFDFSGDNFVGSTDVSRVSRHAGIDYPFYDFNHNGIVDSTDVSRVSRRAGTSCTP